MMNIEVASQFLINFDLYMFIYMFIVTYVTEHHVCGDFLRQVILKFFLRCQKFFFWMLQLDRTTTSTFIPVVYMLKNSTHNFSNFRVEFF